MSADLTVDLPGTSGFSVRNLKYMRRFAAVYPDSLFVQAVLAQIPWWHNILLIEKLKSQKEREWYAHQVLQNGWSGRALEEAIKSNLYERQGKAVTNFKACLPNPHSRLANDILKSPLRSSFKTSFSAFWLIPDP